MNKRVIQFRVWDVLEKTFIDNGDGLGFIDLAEFESGNEGEKEPDYLFEQFTGLTDKNGKEIYEGDIVRRDKHELTPGNILDYEVVFIRGSFLIFRPYGEHHTTNLGSMTGIISVIGNIHENPELLK